MISRRVNYRLFYECLCVLLLFSEARPTAGGNCAEQNAKESEEHPAANQARPDQLQLKCSVDKNTGFNLLGSLLSICPVLNVSRQRT